MSNHTPVLKRCTACGELKPATTDYFFRFGNGLLRRCKVCENARKNRWLAENPERAKKNRHNQYLKHRDKVLEYTKQYQQKNRAKVNEQARKRRQADPERANEVARRFREIHPDRVNESLRRYRQNHPDRIKETQAKYLRNHRNQANIKESRKRARKRSLSNTLTAREWQDCLTYFGNCCAVCGRSPDSESKLAIDHWIPLASPDCPGTVVANIIPLCHGEGGCNNSKCDSDPIQWLRSRLGEQEASEVLKRINAYFDQLKGDQRDLESDDHNWKRGPRP